MMTSDTMWGGNPHRAHNLGMRPFYEANKVGHIATGTVGAPRSAEGTRYRTH